MGSRRTASKTAWLVPLLLAAASTPAFAQGSDEFGSFQQHSASRRHTEQSGAFEARLSPYTPKIDDEFNGATPYADTFTSDARYWLFGLEADWQLMRIPHLGSLGPGFGWGYWSRSARAPLTATGEASGQETSLWIMPMYAVGVLRVDVFSRDFGVPLVPYAKAGLGYALWSISSGDDTATDDAGLTGRGASYGYQFALGGMFLLDVLDEESAIEMETSSGVDNSYFFLEWYVSDLNGFGSGEQMQVGTNTWVMGLTFEF